MSKWRLALLFAFLLLPYPVDAAFFDRNNCDEVPSNQRVAEGTFCLQRTTAGGRGAGITYIWNGTAWRQDSNIPRVTFANLPASPKTGDVVVVTDALSSTVCTAGGGTANNSCQWNGSAWVIIGGGGGGTGTPGGLDTQCQFNDGGAFGGDPGCTYNKTTDTLTIAGNVSVAGQSVCRADGTNCPGAGSFQPIDADLTDLAANSTAGFWAAATNIARSMATASTNNITITNPTGAGGNPTWDVGPNVALSSRAFTAGNFDYNFGGGASLTPPGSSGATPTTNFRIAGNTSTNRLVYGVGGSTFIVAHTGEIQPLSTGLTQLSSLSPVNNSMIVHNGTIWTTLTRPSCSGANQAINFDATTHAEGCVTIATGGISGTSGRIAKINPGGVTAGDSIMSEAAGVVTVAGGLVVGSGASLIWNTSAITVDRTWTILDVSGTIRPATGAFVAGQFVTTNASGQLIDAGPAAGAGTWTDASVNTGTNKTLDESSNTLKITKSVQAELYAPTTANATCTGCYYFRVPVSLNGTNLVGVQSNVVTAGTTGLASVQITRCAAVATTPLCSGTTASMLSTVLSIDSGETSSSTAATAAVINTANDDVATGQILRFDVTAIHTTPAQGLIVNLDFKLP